MCIFGILPFPAHCALILPLLFLVGLNFLKTNLHLFDPLNHLLSSGSHQLAKETIASFQFNPSKTEFVPASRLRNRSPAISGTTPSLSSRHTLRQSEKCLPCKDLLSLRANPLASTARSSPNSRSQRPIILHEKTPSFRKSTSLPKGWTLKMRPPTHRRISRRRCLSSLEARGRLTSSSARQGTPLTPIWRNGTKRERCLAL